MVSIEEIECVHIKKNLVFGIQKLYTQFIKIPLLCDNLPIKLLYKLYKKSTFTSSAILHTTANHRAYGVCPKRGRSRSPTHVNSVCLFVCYYFPVGRARLFMVSRLQVSQHIFAQASEEHQLRRMAALQ